MADAKIDQNYEKTNLAVTDDANATPVPLLCDPILDYLEIDLILITPHTDNVLTDKIDDNYEGVGLVYNDSTDAVVPLKVDAATGRLWVDITAM